MKAEAKARHRKENVCLATREARQRGEKVSRGQLCDLCSNIRGRNMKDKQTDNFTEWFCSACTTALHKHWTWASIGFPCASVDGLSKKHCNKTCSDSAQKPAPILLTVLVKKLQEFPRYELEWVRPEKPWLLQSLQWMILHSVLPVFYDS